MKERTLYEKIYAVLNGIGNIINIVCLVCACLACIGMFVSLMWGVFTRYVIGFQAIWTEEMARYCLIWMTMTGCSVAWKRNALTRFTVLLDRMSEGTRLIWEILVILMVAAYLGFFCVSGNAAMVVFKITKASVMKFSLKYVAAGLYMGAAAMIYHCIPKLMEAVKAAIDYHRNKNTDAKEAC